jgi:hypothetical protein
MGPPLASGKVTRAKRANAAVFFVFTFSVFVVSFFLHPVDSGVSMCIFRNLTGLPCPSCGLTRAFCAFSQLDFHKAFGHYPLVPLAYAFWLTVIVSSFWTAASGMNLADRIWRKINRQVTAGAITLLAASWTFILIRHFHEHSLAESLKSTLIVRIVHWMSLC